MKRGSLVLSLFLVSILLISGCANSTGFAILGAGGDKGSSDSISSSKSSSSSSVSDTQFVKKIEELKDNIGELEEMVEDTSSPSFGQKSTNKNLFSNLYPA